LKKVGNLTLLYQKRFYSKRLSPNKVVAVPDWAIQDTVIGR